MPKRLYRTLLLAEKLPPAVLGTAQIACDIEADTLHVAYLAQYPQRAREIVHVGLIGTGVVVSVVAYYLLWQGDASLLALLIALAVIAVVALVPALSADSVFKAASLAMHYRNERRRMAEHWAFLHEMRDRVPVDA